MCEVEADLAGIAYVDVQKAFEKLPHQSLQKRSRNREKAKGIPSN